MSKATSHIGVVILAAGESRRMGAPKQLLKVHGESLIRKAVHNALGSGAGKVVVVLGAYADQIQKEMESLRVGRVINEDWKQGMSSSIRCGLDQLLKEEQNLQGVLLMVCDQPDLTSESLKRLVLHSCQGNGEHGIIAARYNHHLGTPALFSRKYFKKLLELKGDQGARKILKQNEAKIVAVDMPEAARDWDEEVDTKQIGFNFGT